MAGRKIRKKFLATLVTENKSPCVFCLRIVDDEVTYGKLYALGDIQCHYFCVLLSCCLIQKGKDEEGLFGFMYPDILAEVERCKKHRCSYCGKYGANLGCTVSQCRKQFHLPCGREKNAVSLFYGNYKSFCKDHAPKQKIPAHIMAQAKLRMKLARGSKDLKLKAADLNNLKELKMTPNGGLSSDNNVANADTGGTESVCVICYEAVDGFPTVQTFWPPCCARDAWFHRTCLQRMALSAGMHYLKCPLCNDKDNFYDAVVDQGYYVPDRDAAWELEQNAFAEIYERPLSCSATECKCPKGRDHDSDVGLWQMKLCILCGTLGAHVGCAGAAAAAASARHVCDTCATVAPEDLHSLADSIEALMLEEQRQTEALNSRRGPLMPSRMSLRRTKRIAYNPPSTSRNARVKTETREESKSNTTASRLELNIKSPSKPPPILQPNILRNIENQLLSPIKMLEQSFHEKIQCMGVREIEVDSQRVLEELRDKFRKPRPLSEKRRIVNHILDSLFVDIIKENPKTKEVIKDWNSPRKNSIEEQEETDSRKPQIVEIKEETPIQTNTPTKLTESTVPETNITNTPEKLTETFKQETIDPKITETETIDTKTDPVNNTEQNCDETSLQNIDDESTNSTFQLPPEFIADSDNSLPILDNTPKKLKTVDIQKDSSLEISANEEVINIDVVKMEENFFKSINLTPVKPSFKFSLLDKEINKSHDIDLESFKDHYLKEVDRYKCNYSHKHKHGVTDDIKPKLRTAIDFAIDAIFKKEDKPQTKKSKRKLDSVEFDAIFKKKEKPHTNKLKRKLDSDDSKVPKKKQKDKCILKYDQNKAKVKLVRSNTEKVTETIDLTIESRKEKRKRKKLRKKNKKLHENIQVKIKWKKEQLRLKITKSQKRKNKKVAKGLKQYILKCTPETSKGVLMKPEFDVTPKKRKYTKLDKSPDNLVQTSIQNFFKVKPSK